MAPSEVASIMWIEDRYDEIKKIYPKAKQIHNRKINLVTYFPAEVWKTKFKLFEHCKKTGTKLIINVSNYD